MSNISIGSGADTLQIAVSEDAYQGDAQLTVGVDGQQVGGVLTATTPHASGNVDVVNVLGDWAEGPHTVTVNFLNDAWGGTDATDRNLYLNGATYDNAGVPGIAQKLSNSGPVSFGVTDTTPVPAPAYYNTITTVGSGSDTLTLKVSEDGFRDYSQFTVSVDGQQVGDILTATAAHGSSQSDLVNVLGNWAAGPHTVTVNFLNDIWGGSPDTDRNLYVDSATFNGAEVSSAALALYSNGPQSFGLTDPGSTFVWNGNNSSPQPEVNRGDRLVLTGGTYTAQGGQLSGVTVYLNGGSQTSPTTLAVQDGSIGKLQLESFDDPVRYSSRGNLDVSGTVTIESGLIWGGRVAPSYLNVTLNNAATLNLNGGGIGNAASFVVNGSPGSTVTNTGTLSVGGVISFAIHADLAGAGTLQSVRSSDSSGGTIELDGAVSAGQTVLLDAGTLQLDQPARFLGTVAGLISRTDPAGGPSSRLVLEHTTVTGTLFQQGADNAGDLSVFTQDQATGAATTDVIHVAGSYAPDAFVFTNNATTQSALIQLSRPSVVG